MIIGAQPVDADLFAEEQLGVVVRREGAGMVNNMLLSNASRRIQRKKGRFPHTNNISCCLTATMGCRKVNVKRRLQAIAIV